MVDLISRREWNAREPREVTRLAADPVGVKVHYLAGRVDPAIVHDHRKCVELVAEVQGWHMDGNGWGDVGYTGLVCPHRAVFVGRGPHVLPAANGAGLNAGHYALVCLLGEQGLVTPPDGMLAGLVDGIRWLRTEGDAGKEIAGHCDGYKTECPGEPLYKVVKRWQRDGLPAAERAPRAPAPPPFARVLQQPPVMTGEDVRLWQAQMARRGWLIEVDGVFGPGSEDVAAEFARRRGFDKAGGRVTRPVWDAAWLLPVT